MHTTPTHKSLQNAGMMNERDARAERQGNRKVATPRTEWRPSEICVLRGAGLAMTSLFNPAVAGRTPSVVSAIAYPPVESAHGIKFLGLSRKAGKVGAEQVRRYPFLGRFPCMKQVLPLSGLRERQVGNDFFGGSG